MSKWNSLAKSALLVSIVTVFTLIFSFVKEAVYANYYGASYITDAYSIAIQIPVTLFSMVSMAISNVALPYYSKKLNIDSREASSRYISNLMTIVTILTIGIVLILEVFPGVVINAFAPGLNEEAKNLAILLFRLIVPTIILTELININTAIQDVHKSFALPQFGSVILNSVFVAIVIIFAKTRGIYAAVFGTIIGTIIEFSYSVLLRRRFLKYNWVCDFKDKDVISSVKKAGPVFLGLGVAELNKTIDTIFSSFLESGSVSMIGYASKLSSAISSLLVGGIVKVTYPEFAESAAKNDDVRMAECLHFSIKIVLMLLLPVVVGGTVLGKEIISIVYFRGAFKMSTVIGTAPIFVAYLTCLVFRAFRQNFSRVFYSYGDTKTPMMNAIIGLLVNSVLDYLLYKKFGATGIAWATTGTYVAVSFSLAVSVKRRNHFISYRSIIPTLIRVFVSAGVMGIAVYAIRKVFVMANFYDINSVTRNGIFLIVSVLVGAIVYYLSLLLLKTKEIVDMTKAILRRGK